MSQLIQSSAEISQLIEYCRAVTLLTSTYNKHIKEKVQKTNHGLVQAKVALQ